MRIPPELSELWLHAETLRLFEDVDTGQWGCVTMSPQEVLVRTADAMEDLRGDIRPDDVVVAEFLGDQDLLMYCPSEEPAAQWRVSVGFEHRPDWPVVGPGLFDFLESMLGARGEKFWE